MRVPLITSIANERTQTDTLELFLSKLTAFICILATTITLSACAIDPSTIVKTPTTAKPAATSSNTAKNGGIFVASAYKPMFEDRRPRFVGDILTINIVEKTSATKAGSNQSSKAGSVKGSVANSFGSPLPNAALEASSSNSLDEKAGADASNKFNGSVGVTVMDVLPNGNLVVSGEKQVAFDKGTEFVRFSGVVNPDNISQGNVVASNRVADARIEYRSNSKMDAAQALSILSRFFLSFIPI